MGTGQSVVVQEHLAKWESALGELEQISAANRKMMEQDRIFGNGTASFDHAEVDRSNAGVNGGNGGVSMAVGRRPSSLISFGNGNGNDNANSDGAPSRPRSGHKGSPGERIVEPRNFDRAGGSAGSKDPPKHSRQQVLENKAARVDLFKSYLPNQPEMLGDLMACGHFGTTALALSYLLGGKKNSADRREKVTVEDIFFAAQVPLHMLHTGPPHLPVFADIVREFLDVDNRFREEYTVQEFHLDVSPTVGQVDLGPNEVGDRQTRMQLPEFCRAITRDCEETKVITIVNFDPYVLEQEMIVDAYDDEEELNSPLAASVLGGNPRMPKRIYSPDNDGAYAVIVDVRNAVQLMVTIAEGIVNDSLHVKMMEVAAASLFKAMMTAEEGHRARGFLRIAKKGFDTSDENYQEPVTPFWSPELCSGKVLGTLEEGTHAAAINHHISPHIVGVSWALHLLGGVRTDAHGYGKGLPVSDIIRTMKFPTEVFLDGVLPLDQVYEYSKEYLKIKGLPYSVKLYPVLTKISREDAVPTISVFDLESILIDVGKANDDSESPEVVMVTMYNACVAHNVLYIADQPQWAVLAGYDVESQTVLLIDSHPKTFSHTWTCSLERLHKAITGTGYMIFSKRPEKADVGAPKSTPPMVLSRLQLLKEQNRGVSSWKAETLVKSLTFPSLPVIPTTISMVCSKLLKKIVSIEDVIHLLPYEVSSLLNRFFTLETLNVCFSKFLIHSDVANAIQVKSYHCEVNAEGKQSLGLRDFEKLLSEHVTEDKVLVVLFDSKRIQVHGTGSPFGNLAVVTGYDANTNVVTVVDSNPNRFLCCWTTTVPLLHFALTTQDNNQNRHRTYGCLSVHCGPPTRHTFPRENSHHFHLESLPVQNIFHVSPSPHFQGMSFAFSQLQEFYSPEEIFYEAYLKTMDDQRRRGSQAFAWRDVDVSLSVINKSIDASFMAQVCTKFLESRASHHKSTNTLHKEDGETHVEVERLDDIDEEELVELLDSCTMNPNVVLLLNYDTLKARGLDNMGRNVALVKSFDKEEGLVELWDAEYAVFGLYFVVTVDELIKMGDIENEGKSPYGFVKFERCPGPYKKTGASGGLMRAPRSQEEEDAVEAEMAAKRGINFLGEK